MNGSFLGIARPDLRNDASAKPERLAPLRRDAWMIAVLVLTMFSGCGDSGETLPVARLSGTVTIDGKPIEKGQILFAPRSSGQAPPTTVDIVEGRYEADAVPLGSVSVIISAVRETGRQSTEYSEPFAEYENLIPEKYRDGIELEVAGENLQQDFALLSKR